jgi:hypothetical protein
MKKIPRAVWPIAGALIAFAAVAFASTTISTDINTAGNLTAGTSTLANLTIGNTSTSTLCGRTEHHVRMFGSQRYMPLVWQFRNARRSPIYRPIQL